MARHDPANDQLFGGDLDQQTIGGDGIAEWYLANALALLALRGDCGQGAALDQRQFKGGGGIKNRPHEMISGGTAIGYAVGRHNHAPLFLNGTLDA